MSMIRIQAVTDQHAMADDGVTILRTKMLVWPTQVDDNIVIPPFASKEINGAYAIWVETQAKADGSGNAVNPVEVIKTRLANANKAGKQLMLVCELSGVKVSDVAKGNADKGNGDKSYQTITLNINRNAKRQLVEIEPAGWVLD